MKSMCMNSKFVHVLLLQVTLATQRAQAAGHGLRYAAARTALWLLNDFPAHLEAFLFPDALSLQVSSGW